MILSSLPDDERRYFLLVKRGKFGGGRGPGGEQLAGAGARRPRLARVAEEQAPLARSNGDAAPRRDSKYARHSWQGLPAQRFSLRMRIPAHNAVVSERYGEQNAIGRPGHAIHLLVWLRYLPYRLLAAHLPARDRSVARACRQSRPIGRPAQYSRATAAHCPRRYHLSRWRPGGSERCIWQGIDHDLASQPQRQARAGGPVHAFYDAFAAMQDQRQLALLRHIPESYLASPADGEHTAIRRPAHTYALSRVRRLNLL